MKSGSLRFSIAVAMLLFAAFLLPARREIVPRKIECGSGDKHGTPTYEPPSCVPRQLDGWLSDVDEKLDEETLNKLGYPEYVLRVYSRRGTAESVELFIPYYASQSVGDTIHSPEHCLPGAGWEPVSHEVIHLASPDGFSFPAKRYVVVKGGDRQLVLYWFQAHGRAVASEYAAKYYLIRDSIRMNRSDGALVRLRTEMRNGESPEAAQQRIMALAVNFYPADLDRYIPR
jgi:EpsI family protein